MIDVVIIAKGKDHLLRSISSVFYQVQVMEANVYVYMEESFDYSDYSSFPIGFYDSWDELKKVLKKGDNPYLYFLHEGDALSNPFVFNSFLKELKDSSAKAIFGCYILDKGDFNYEDIADDVFHYYGKMYRKDYFLKHFPKELSFSNFFFFNQSLVFKDEVVWKGNLRNYLVCNEHYADPKLWERNLNTNDAIEVVSKLKKQYPKASYDLVISTLLTSYSHYLKGEDIIQKELLASLIPKEISYSEWNLSIVKENQILVYILQNKLSFIEYLKKLQEGKIC